MRAEELLLVFTVPSAHTHPTIITHQFSQMRRQSTDHGIFHWQKTIQSPRGSILCVCVCVSLHATNTFVWHYRALNEACYWFSTGGLGFAVVWLIMEMSIAGSPVTFQFISAYKKFKYHSSPHYFHTARESLVLIKIWIKSRFERIIMGIDFIGCTMQEKPKGLVWYSVCLFALDAKNYILGN